MLPDCPIFFVDALDYLPGQSHLKERKRNCFEGHGFIRAETGREERSGFSR
jgi:hypothetical protein